MSLYMHVCVWVCAHECHAHGGKKGMSENPGAVVTVDCEPLDVVTGD